MVYVSMGTLQNGVRETFRAIARSARRLTRLQFVLAIGNQIAPEQIGETPSNVLMVPWAPQIELLKRSSLCITHAGLNTVLEALGFGVPLVAMPITNDLPGVAARIEHKEGLCGLGQFFLEFESEANWIERRPWIWKVEFNWPG